MSCASRVLPHRLPLSVAPTQSSFSPTSDARRVDGWRHKRVRALPAGDGAYWSDISPAAQRLARDTVLASSDGAAAWDALGDADGDGAPRLPFSVHLWHADGRGEPGGTVVELSGPGGIDDMARRCPAARVKFFAGAGHSIHGSAAEAFDAALREVIVESAAAS